MLIKGDSHRFGRFVSFDPQSSLILKPRNCYLEYLFLDHRSPLKDLQRSLGIMTDTHVEVLEPWRGECENLSPHILKDAEIKEHALYFCELAGKLMAGATVFGLNDLHFENVLFIKKKGELSLVPVDLEIIFYKFITSAENCLYPSIKVDSESCGLKRLLPFIDESGLIKLTDAFIEAWKTLSQKSKDVRSLISGIPVRMLYRPTRDYDQYIKTNNLNIFNSHPMPLTSEELLQLKHGDIPYFFSYPESPDDIFFFDTPYSTAQAHEMIRHPSQKRHLSADESLSDQFFFTSLAHLLTNMLKAQQFSLTKLTGENFTAEISKEYLIISIGGQTLKVKQ